jgi:uncharacterized SAM-binding protein YcdF (DUF218 family)
MKFGSRHIFAGILIGVLLAWGAGLFWFASTLPDSVEDTTTHTDAIVVLTGGSERIETGLRLLSQGLGARLFISGVGEQVSMSDLIARGQPLRPDHMNNIEIGTLASDTPGNAAETAAWAKAEKVRSLRLVTASYHMRRALLEFHASMPNATVIPHAVFPDTVKSDWWRWPGTASLIAREYTKFVVTWARQGFSQTSAQPVERVDVANEKPLAPDLMR